MQYLQYYSKNHLESWRMNFDETKPSAAMIEPDKCRRDGTKTGFSMQQSNTTHHLSCPEELLWWMEPKVMDQMNSQNIL